MKKLSLLLALVLICSSLSGVISLADEPATCTITYFTNDDYLLMSDPGDTWHKIYKSVEVEVEYGHVITSQDIPDFAIYIMGCDVEVAWMGDENPRGFEVTKDMAFEAYIANKPDEIADVRYFGTYICLPDQSVEEAAFTDMTIGYPVGYTLTENDIPCRPAPPPGTINDCDELIWTPDPVGVTVFGGEEFEAELKENLVVRFLDLDHYCIFEDGWQIKCYTNVEYGTAVEPPTEDEIPQYPGEVFIGWDSDDYLCVTSYTEINAEFRPLGDANIDRVVNSGDAAYILRYALDLFQVPNDIDNFDKLADYNGDGQVNTGDAAAVLVAVVNG